MLAKEAEDGQQQQNDDYVTFKTAMKENFQVDDQLVDQIVDSS